MFNSFKINFFKRIVVALPALALALAGCSDDGTSGTTGGGPVDTSPLYAISTIVFSPDLSSRTEHIDFATGLSAQGDVDPAKAIEITSENSAIWPSPNPGEFFLVDTGTGSLIKYGTGATGAVEQKGKISFAAYGVNAFYWTLLAHASPTKSFLFDEITLKGFVWNPTDMTISKEIDLSSQFNTMEGGKQYTIWRERRTIQIGDKFFAAFKYYDRPSAVTLPRSGMLVIDSAADTFTVVEHPTCPGLFNSLLGKDGKIYSASGIIAAAAYFVKQPGVTAPCMVRFDPTTMKWDDTFNVDLGALTGGTVYAGGLVAHEGGPAYIRVLSESDAKILGYTNPLQLSGAQIWYTYKLDSLEDPKSATKVTTPAAGGLLYPFTIDGKTYTSDASVPTGKSWFVDISVDPPARALKMDGWGYYALRVR